MTIYILGGSSTAMAGGWAEAFAIQNFRRFPVRNLAMGAANTLMAVVRLYRDVDLREGDVVIWASAIRDVMCMSAGTHRDRSLLRYTEELIRRCAEAKARFIPLLMDTANRDLDIVQQSHKAALLSLLRKYKLNWIDVTAEYQAETGENRIPLGYYDRTGHIAAGSEMIGFIADLVTVAVRAETPPPPVRTPVECRLDRRIRIIDIFAPDAQAQAYENQLMSDTLWMPPLTLPTDLDIPNGSRLEAMVLLTDTVGGAFDVRMGDTIFSLSATCLVRHHHAPMALTVYLPNVLAKVPTMPAADEFEITWSNGDGPILSDNFFRPEQEIPTLGPTRSRVQCLVLDEPTDPNR